MVKTVNFRNKALALLLLQAVCFASLSPSLAATSSNKSTKTTHAKTTHAKTKQTKTTHAKVSTSKKTNPLTSHSFLAQPKKTGVKSKKSAKVKKSSSLKRRSTYHRYIYHRPTLKPVEPSPSPKWPPTGGFSSFGTAYARIPTGSELVGILSAMKHPAASVNSCSPDPKNPSAPAYSCAAVLVGSSVQCLWWNVSSIITGIDPANSANRIDLGSISMYAVAGPPKLIQTIIVVSPIPLQDGVRFTNLQVTCGVQPVSEPIPSTLFTPMTPSTPSPTDSAEASATPSPSNS